MRAGLEIACLDATEGGGKKGRVIKHLAGNDFVSELIVDVLPTFSLIQEDAVLCERIAEGGGQDDQSGIAQSHRERDQRDVGLPEVYAQPQELGGRR